MIEKYQCQPEPERAYRFPIGAASLCCIFVALLWGGLSLHLKSDRERMLQDAERENSRLARVFEEHVIRTIRAADLTLHHIESQYKRLGRKLDLVQFAKEHQVRQDPYTSLNIVDDKGFLALSSVPPHVRVDYSRNDNVVFHRQNKTPGLFISTPRLGARTKLWSVYLSRRINNPDGSLAGNSSLALDPFYFTKFYGDLDLGRGALVALVGRDGVTRARIVDGEMSAGRDLGATSLFSRHLPTSASGFYRETSTRDATARLYSYRALTDYPLVVIVSAAEATVLAPYVARRDLYLVLATGISAAILLFGYLVVSQHQKQMVAASMLRESEERFKAFMDRVPVIAFIKDEFGRYIYVNKTWEEIYALDWRGKTDTELWPRDNAVMFSESDRRAVDAGEATEVFETVADKDGRAQDWWVMKFPVVDSHGKCLLGGIAMDITERKAAEHALWASETKLHRVTDAIPGAVYQYQLRADGSQSFISISDGIQDLIGHSAAAVVNDFSLLWNALLAEDQEVCSSSILRSAQAMAPWEFEGRVRLSNGSLKWLRGHSVPEPRRPDGSIVWNGILTDITERKRNELERARLAAIVENSQDAIISRDLDLNIITWNPAAERLFGYTADEAVGQSVELLIPSDKQAEVAHRRSQLNQGVETSPFDTVRIGRDGKRIDVSVTQSPIRDTSGNLVGVSLSLRDITERKRMGKSLQLTQFSIDRAVDGIFWILPSGEIIYANDAACRILGYARDELVGKTVPDIDPSFPADKWPAHWEDLRQKGSLRFESDHRTKDGRLLTTELTVKFIVYEGEEYTCAFMRDISARKEAEQALRHAHVELERRVDERTTELRQVVARLKKTEAMLHQAVDVADIGIFERDHDSGQVYYSPTLKKILGLSDDQPGRVGDYMSSVYGDDREMVNLARRRAHLPSEHGHISLEHRIARRDGSAGWVLFRGHTFFDGAGDGRRPVRTVGAVLDITERKRAEDALQTSEARLQYALTIGKMGSWERDLRTHKISWDERTYDIFGIPKGTEINRDLFLAHVDPDHVDAVRNAHETSISTGIDYDYDFRFNRPDGRTIWIHANGGLRRDRNGTTTHLAGINLDITERKAAEEALRKLNEQLDQRVMQRTQELAESQAGLRALVAELTKAEERERRRLAVELHDTLAQSLAVVNMYLWRVRELVGSQGNDASIDEVLANLDRTVDDSIKYTRSLIAELSPPVLYDLGLPAAFRWLGEQMGRHGLRVAVDGPADGFSLAETDAVFLFQCARELLWNVVKHGATDSAKVAYGCDRNRLSLAVVDQGKGFDLQTARANSNGGNHFGLFSIRERVELRGGAFEINSAPGAGTWVSIVIQTDRPDVASSSIATPVPLPETIQPAIGDAIRIVIVDDHKMVRQGLRRVLEEQGRFVVVGEAGDGAEALVVTHDLKPAVVIMDVNMPSMNGIEATEKIIQNRPSTIVIGLSFGTTEYVVEAMQAAGAVTCLAKEHAVEDVSAAILDAVDERQRLIGH